MGFDEKEYSKKWRAENKEKVLESNRKWKAKNKKHIAKYRKKYYEKNHERETAYWKKKTKQNRQEILDIISGGNPICVRCGCDDTRLLEINHINGGGTKETKGNPGSFWNKIRSGERKTNDLELLCKVCNARHYHELKYGKLPYKIIWGK